MGFLKRLFSKKSKKINRHDTNEDVPPTPSAEDLAATLAPVTEGNDEEDEQEVVASRLLRSSSRRFEVVTHPINKVINPPAASSASISSVATQRSTYSVKVHERTRSASTDVSTVLRDNRENKPENDSPDKTSRLLRLRSDPSINSLLDLYDEHGQISNKAFSDGSPEKLQTNERAQLLGDEFADGSENRSREGDISWAERYLGERQDSPISAPSSPEIMTPINPDFRFPDIKSRIPHDRSRPNTPCDEPSFSLSAYYNSSNDMSMNTTETYPTINSMAVEASASGAPSMDGHGPYQNPDPKTPQRASQIFGFITEKRKSQTLDAANPIKGNENEDRPLPQLPSYFSSPSDDGHEEARPTSRKTRSHSTVSSFSKRIAIPHSDDTHSNSNVITEFFKRSRSRSRSHSRHRTHSSGKSSSSDKTYLGASNSHTKHASIDRPTTPGNDRQRTTTASTAGNTTQDSVEPQVSKAQKVRVILNAPTKVIVTAPTPGHEMDATPNQSRIPRGPRDRRRKSHSSRDHVSRPRPLTERSSAAQRERRVSSERERRVSSDRRAQEYKRRAAGLEYRAPESRIPGANRRTSEADRRPSGTPRRASETSRIPERRRPGAAAQRISSIASDVLSNTSLVDCVLVERPPRRDLGEAENGKPAKMEHAADTTIRAVPSSPKKTAPGSPKKAAKENMFKENAPLKENTFKENAPPPSPKKPSAIPVSPTKKGASLGLAVQAELPSTPMRYSLHRAAVTPAAFRVPAEAPSPASSSEMSPVGRQMQMEVRKQRMRTREVERSKAPRLAV
ncbi:hypothetical protein HDZ31DRAFT_41377 [Schizophyllum fasciatum]